jgi:hypothetical protein
VFQVGSCVRTAGADGLGAARVKHRTRVLIVLGSAVFVIAVVWAYFEQYLTLIPAAVLWTVAVAVDVVIALLSWFGGKPRLIVRPLPHFKGWMIPTGSKQDWEFYAGDQPRLGPKPTWGTPSHPERIGHGMHPSQVLELVWLDASKHPGHKGQSRPARPGEDGPNVTEVTVNEQAYKFGVLSVTNDGAEAEHCSAHGHYRVRGHPEWVDLGELNWYSRARRSALKINTSKAQAIVHNPVEGLNDVLAEPLVDISSGATEEDEFDLPLFYMLCNPEAPYVFMCASQWTPVAGQASAGRHLRVAIKVRFKARGMPPFTKSYRASIAPDDYKITEEGPNDRPL